MKFIIIYGPPAVGKLTVAKELVKITGYKLFHNHLTVDLAYSLFSFGTKAYSDLVEKIRLDLIEFAAKNKIKGMIFTFVYGAKPHDGKKDNQFIKKIISIVKKYGGRVYFVKLSCDKKELHKRLKHPARKEFKKLGNIKTLNFIWNEYDIDSPIPFVKNQVIDNTSLPPEKVARMIKKYYKL